MIPFLIPEGPKVLGTPEGRVWGQTSQELEDVIVCIQPTEPSTVSPPCSARTSGAHLSLLPHPTAHIPGETIRGQMDDCPLISREFCALKIYTCLCMSMHTHTHTHTHTPLLPDLGVKRWKDECKSGKSEKLTGTYLLEVKLIFLKRSRRKRRKYWSVLHEEQWLDKKKILLHSAH